jgi:HEPN domain-containing protein
MVNIDIERAKELLGSAMFLYESGDYSGVAGLAYQAFESATMALLEGKNGKDKRSHSARRKRVKELIEAKDETIDRLWTLRNIDFYGNSSIGESKRDITEEEAKDCLENVEDLIAEIEELLDE